MLPTDTYNSRVFPSMALNPINERIRSLEQALADLLAKNEKQPTAELARMLRQLELEVAERKRAAAAGPRR